MVYRKVSKQYLNMSASAVAINRIAFHFSIVTVVSRSSCSCLKVQNKNCPEPGISFWVQVRSSHTFSPIINNSKTISNSCTLHLSLKKTPKSFSNQHRHPRIISSPSETLVSVGGTQKVFISTEQNYTVI